MNRFQKTLVFNLAITNVSFFVCVVASAQEVDFNTQIRPIISRNCIACHGPDPEQRQADFRIDTAEGVDGLIEPGDAESSEVFLRIISDDSDERMPPLEHGKPLTKGEIELVRNWINEGASYQTHWSFVKPEKPDLPQVQNNTWPRNEIDNFVLRKLEKENLLPSKDAEPARLIRRTALDLTGLPPTQDQVARFIAAPTDETFSLIVDELLASPAYGEHWAAMWLDLARYADSFGYASDETRTIWPWRDWVIRSFNENMPYDQFTIEQLAGDLLPDATVDQRLATALHRNTLNNTEGGTNDEEFRTIAVKDRMSTTANVWMGLTLRCAECHSHKYDPISQKEYYQFLDFFNQTVDSDKNDDRPRLDVYPEGREVEFAKLDSEIEQARKAAGALAEPSWSVLEPVSATSSGGATFETLADQSVIATGDNPDSDEYTLTFNLPTGKTTGLRLEVIPDPRNGGKVGRSPEGAFVISQIRASLKVGDQFEPIKFSHGEADFEQASYGFKLTIRDKIDKAGWAVGNPSDGFRNQRNGYLSLAKAITVDEPTELKFFITHKSPWPKSNAGRIRLSTSSSELPAEKIRDKKLAQKKIDDLVKRRNSPIRVPVIQELEVNKRRKTHVMIRGSFLQPGEEVSAAVMESFHPLTAAAKKNRLGVANWLLSPENPLTARVTVNRFWARLFGKGIVETEEDFGTQGSSPTHLELLDWLAVDFRENGWDVKRLLKQIVMSSAYRQSGFANEEKYQLDPRNNWLSRGPRFRLRAEVVRDQALAVSGLLSNRMFGPPVFPPNPVKRVVSAFTGGMTWQESTGSNRYRRAMYTFLKRTSPHPLFETFDMATREVCNLRRIRTNTPLQAFMTLNDPSFVEAAQGLAKMMRQHSEDIEARIRFGLKSALFRQPNLEQVATLSELYQSTLQHYATATEQARQLSGTDANTTDAVASELAALTVVSNVILNLDEFLSR